MLLGQTVHDIDETRRSPVLNDSLLLLFIFSINSTNVNDKKTSIAADRESS